jgi:hypothetical protein
MKNRFWIYIFALAVIILIVLLCWRPTQQTAIPEPAIATAQPTNTPAAMIGTTGNPSPTGSTLVSTPPIERAVSTATNQNTDESRALRLQQIISAKNGPIEFYGQVIDQDSNPVPAVKINVSISQTYMPSSTNLAIGAKVVHLEKETGANGRFDIQGVEGNGFDVESIQKAGYELSPTTSHSYGAIGGSFENPVVFKMWRTGEKAQLVGGSKFWGIIPDGRIYAIDLLQGTKEESGNAVGDLKISVNRPAGVSRQDHYDWSFQITPIDGGIIETEDDFMYEAPESGYLPEYNFHLIKSDAKWTYRVKRNFYIKTRGGQNYGRISVEVFAYYQNEGVFNIDWAVNPAGSRNLQP